ncbi:MAG: helix-turn-helix domain-containing protein [Arachnia sp.]
MTRSLPAPEPLTYLPGDHELSGFARALDGLGMTPSDLSLVGPEGREIEVPDVIYRLLDYATETLLSGLAVTIVPRHCQATLDEAADFLGISKPALAELVSSRQIVASKAGPHSVIELQELQRHQENARERRRDALNRLAEESTSDGIYAATDKVTG